MRSIFYSLIYSIFFSCSVNKSYDTKVESDEFQIVCGPTSISLKKVIFNNKEVCSVLDDPFMYKSNDNIYLSHDEILSCMTDQLAERNKNYEDYIINVFTDILKILKRYDFNLQDIECIDKKIIDYLLPIRNKEAQHLIFEFAKIDICKSEINLFSNGDIDSHLGYTIGNNLFKSYASESHNKKFQRQLYNKSSELKFDSKFKDYCFRQSELNKLILHELRQLLKIKS